MACDMDVSIFQKHTVSECNCCGLVIVVDNGPRYQFGKFSYPVSGPISEAYKAHLDGAPTCKAWHDNLPKLSEMRGILRSEPR
jgi:hypothetical protein